MNKGSVGLSGYRIYLTCIAVAVLALASCLAPAGAVALTGTQSLTFGDYPEGTEISTQYEPLGIVFRDEFGLFPEIRWDNSASTNPVLAGTFGFGSTVGAQFVAPGTTTPAAVENLALDVGYINEPGSTLVRVERTSGPTTLYADDYGFDRVSLTAKDITGFTVESVEGEPAGWAIDNLEYTIPTPPPPPPPPAPAPVVAPTPACPAYVIYDSRGSGETKGVLSKPGAKFLTGFLPRLASLKKPATFAKELNPYKAVGVFKFNGQLVNGLGAILHQGEIGEYWKSVAEGERELEAFLKRALASPCGSSGATKMILLGYSQGAQVTGNVYDRVYPRLSKSERAQIGAVVLWGDPRWNPLDLTADRDNQVLVGLLGPRSRFPDPAKVFSYCNEHDPVCQEPLPLAVLAYYRGREHSLYYNTDEAKNNGSAVASFLAKG